MGDNRDNPMGLNGFEFVEFTHREPEALASLFAMMGFTHVGSHRSKNVRHYAQGDIHFLINMEPQGQVADFREKHGASANAMAFRVKDAAQALKLAVERGAVPVEGRVGPAELNIPAIEGIGGANLYLVDSRGAATIYDIDFEPVAGACFSRFLLKIWLGRFSLRSSSARAMMALARAISRPCLQVLSLTRCGGA